MNRSKLTDIEIRGFKSFGYDRPLQLDLRDINILLGANGAGKSNLFAFFKMLSFMMSGSLQAFVAQNGFNYNLLHYGPKKTPLLSGCLRFENDQMVDIYRFSLTHAQESLIFNHEEIEWGRIGDNPQILKPELSFKESALTYINKPPYSIVRNMLAGCKTYQFHDTSATGTLRMASTIDSAPYLQSEGNNLASFLYYLQQNFPESYRRIVSYVRMVIPQFRDFYLEPTPKGYILLKWKDHAGDDYVLGPSQFSDGSLRYIALATLLLQPEKTMPNIIVIDEPELGLHPYAIGQLIEMIKDASLHAQIIVATQSPALVDGFETEDVAVLEWLDDERCTQARRLQAAELDEWLKDYTLSELWDKNIIGGRPL